MKVNCWGFFHCGRELGGMNSGKDGVCPAVTYTAFNRVNGGFNGGRYCWEIAGTFPERGSSCPLAANLEDCRICKFYLLVKHEEGNRFVR